MDADESTTQLKNRKRRDLANLLRRAQVLVHDTNIKVAEPKPKRQPMVGSPKFICYGSLGMAIKKKFLKHRRQRRRANVKARDIRGNTLIRPGWHYAGSDRCS